MNKKTFENSTDTLKIVTLIGMMGSGKTKFGSFLSHKLRYEFYDIDSMIEKKFSKTISEIFKQKNENYFRNEEKKTIYNVVKTIKRKNINSIISLGGGGFDNVEIQKLLLLNSFVVWLDCPIHILVKRIGHTKNRPMLQTNIERSLRILLTKRMSHYKKAHLKFDTSNITFNKMTNEILNNI